MFPSFLSLQYYDWASNPNAYLMDDNGNNVQVWCCSHEIAL